MSAPAVAAPSADGEESDFEEQPPQQYRICKLFDKRAKCPGNDAGEVLYGCANPKCDKFSHWTCSKLLLDHHKVPGESRPTNETVVFCTKTCFGKWEAKQKAERREKERAASKAAKEAAKGKDGQAQPWDADGSMEVLIDWITTEGNWAKYCGGAGNNGKSKRAHRKDITILIKRKLGIDRTELQLANKISTLERSFKAATDWIANTGQGLDNPGDVEAYVKDKLCPLYYDLEAVMAERPNARPLGTNEGDLPPLDPFLNGDEPAFDYRASSDEEMEQEKRPAELVVVDGSGSTPTSAVAGASTLAPETPAAAADSRKRKNGGKTPGKRLKATPTTKKPTPEEEAFSFITSNLDGNPEDGGFHSISERNVAAREKEANARMLEATANSDKAKEETEGVRKANAKADMENTMYRMEMTKKILFMRKEAIDNGECTQEEAKELFPFPK